PHGSPGFAKRVGSGNSTFDRLRRIAIARFKGVKRRSPFLDELKPVAPEQEFLEPASTAGPLVMADAGGRLVEHHETMRPQRHPEVHVNVIDRVKALIKAAHDVPGCGPYEERTGTTIIDCSNVSKCIRPRGGADPRG